MKFQPWLLVVISSLVVGMTAVFLAIVIGQFRSVAETDAQQQFELLARRLADPLRAEFQNLARKVQTEARLGPESYVRDGEINTETLMPLMMSSLRQHPDLSSQYFGLAADTFVQVTALRGEPAWLTALQAPPGSWFGVRTITRDGRGGRTEQWRFLDANGFVLARREAPASYRPTERSWYAGALQTRGAFISDPYTYSSTGMLGLTVAAALPDGAGVYGIDMTIDALSTALARAKASPNAALAIVDSRGRVLGWHGFGEKVGAVRVAPLQVLAGHDDPDVKALAGFLDGSDDAGGGLRAIDGEDFVYAIERVGQTDGGALRLLIAAPVTDFTGVVDHARDRVELVAGGILLLLVPLALAGTNRVTKALVGLAANSERLKVLDFSEPPQRIESFLYEVNTLGQSQQVAHHSLRERTQALELARAKLAQIVDNGIRLGREHNRDQLLRDMLAGAREIANCQVTRLFLRTERDTLRFVLQSGQGTQPEFELPLDERGDRLVAPHAVRAGRSVVVDDVDAETRFDMSKVRDLDGLAGIRTRSMLVVPLMPREGQVIGVLALVNALDRDSGEVVGFAPDIVGFTEALGAQMAVTLENQNLLQAQKDLMDSMIRIIAGAIDAKSAYTGGHCLRVPELALMLADAAAKTTEGPLAGFGWKNEGELEEFRIGAWLHDCGKVTTPEYVVDKATKLETICNRLHEVRTRFEVLLRDAEIEARKAVAAGGDEAAAWAGYKQRKAQLQDDFAFVAECNVGGEFMAPERVERLKQIAQQGWMRHFSDRIGLSHDEEERLAAEPAPALPAPEPLLADKPRHRVPRGEDKALDPKYGFQVKVPQYLYNFGEVYNLSISRGTLSEEERFKINEHIIQTIVMLDRMPFPPQLKRVPDYAGTHHETLTGTGYPRKLTGEQMTVPMRIMAIADIFEALTASDRPYKKAKTLSESIEILSGFKKRQHIDADLFDLFLTSGVYRQYALRYLKPEQIDEVDVAAYVRS